jgi:hypothetical protein
MEKKKWKNFRKNDLELTERVGLTKETHLILKEQRKIQEKSMARIVNDLIKKEYAKV